MSQRQRLYHGQQQTPPWTFYCILEIPGIPCDVIIVVATPTACGASVHCLWVLDVAMLARLSRLLGRQKGEHNETRGRQNEAGLQPQCRTSRHKWFWGKRSESWGGSGEFLDGGRLQLGFS